MDKKSQQLGMNPGTASYRLIKDLLFSFVEGYGHKCFRCGGSLERENFSIEHKEPWLDSQSPRDMFFDLGNVAYSHKACNIAAGRRPHRKNRSREETKAIESLREREKWSRLPQSDQQARRREKYLKYGC